MTKRRKLKITDEQLATFRQMWAAGKTYKEVEAVTGVSASALGSGRASWGIPARIRANKGAKVIAAELSHSRMLARTVGTLEPLPSLAGFVCDTAEPTDVKVVSHKFMPGRACAWPLDTGPCAAHCETPGPYCDEHRKLAYMTPEEAAEAYLVGKRDQRTRTHRWN